MNSVKLRHCLLFYLLTALIACRQAVITTPEVDAHQQLYQVFNDYHEADLQLNPLSAMFEGDYRFNDKLGNNLTQDYLERSLQLEKNTREKLQAVDYTALNAADQLSYDIFNYYRGMAIESYRDGYARLDNLIPVTQFFSLPNFLAQLGGGTSAQPFKTVKDYENWLSRAGEFPAWVQQAISNMREGMQAHVVLPRVLVQRVLPQLQAHVTASPTQSIFYKPVKKFPAGFSEAERNTLRRTYVQMIKNIIVPAYRELHDFMADEYLPYSRDTVGLGQLPGGAAWYNYIVRYHTTTAMSPREIHEFGLAQVKKLYAQMDAIKAQVGFKGDMQAFFHFLKTDPQFFYKKPAALLQSYRDLKSEIQPRLPKLFDLLPRADFVIKPIEAFRAASSAAAEYMQPAPDGSRPGMFYVNTYDLPARPNWDRESLFLHEAEPGHHFQIAIAQEQTHLPSFQRFEGPTAFVEGWALYAETLGTELGLYRDPYQRMGALVNRIWRANRLVVDTGIHAMGWTREQAIEWMESNTPSSKTDIVAEVERYIAIPGQALSYMIGQHAIQTLRQSAQQALGVKFDIRAFHRQVLEGGAMPLALLDKKINDWVQAQQ